MSRLLAFAMLVVSSADTMSDTKEVVSRLNRRANLVEDGVLVRMLNQNFVKPFLSQKCKNYHDPSTCEDYPRMSFSIWNRYQYSNKTHNRTWFPKAFGLVATPETPIRCLFPGDASTLTRTNLGCGKWLNGPEPPRNRTETDWCDPFPKDFLTNFDGFYELDRFKGARPFFMFNFPEYAGCALKPNQKDVALRAYNAMRQTPFVIQGKGYPWGHPGKQIPTTGSWNEVIVDGVHWNKNAKTQVEAFIIADRCWNQMPQCKQDALKVISDYKDMYGFAPPVVGFSPFHAEGPFYVLDGTEEQVLV